MTTTVENKSLLINLIGIDQRNRNAMVMVFTKEQPGLYVITTAEEADLSIVDLDKYGAEDEWTALQQIKPEQQAIFLSVNENFRDQSHLFLKKPFSINDLISALNTTRDKLSAGDFSNFKNQSFWSRLFSSHFKTSEKKLPQNTRNRSSESVMNEYHSGNNQNEATFLSENGYLINEVKQAVVQANSEGRGIKLQINNQGSIFIDPTEHWVNTDLVPEALKDLCQRSLDDTDIVKRVFTDREFSIYLEEWRSTKLKPVDIDSFLWDLALWTYKGSLPKNTDLHKKNILTYWPDLPRLTQIPNAMRIAALWVSCPMALVETIDVLKIPQENVFDFYTAAYTLGLVQQSDYILDKTTPKTDSGNSDTKISPLKKTEKKQREFYLRILKHLKGHNFNE